MMLRWICDVPAAIDTRERVDATGRRLELGSARRSSQAIAMRPSNVMRELAHALHHVAVVQLEHRAARADHAGAGRLRHVAFGQRPHSIEVGLQPAQLAPDRLIVHRKRSLAQHLAGDVGQLGQLVLRAEQFS